MKKLPQLLITFILLINFPVFAQVQSEEVTSDDTIEFTDRLDFAQGLYSRSMYDMALQEYESILQDYPNHSDISKAQYGYAETLFFMKEYSQAIAAYQEYIDQNEDGEFVESATKRLGEMNYLIGKTSKSMDIFKSLSASKNPEIHSSAGYFLGRIAYDKKEWSIAKEHFLDVVKQEDNPYFDYIYYYLGDIELKLGRVQEAIRYLKQAINTSKSDVKSLSLFSLGQSYFRLNKFNEAYENFMKASDSSRDEAIKQTSRFNAVQSLYRQNDYAKLLSMYDELVIQFKDSKLLIPYKLLSAKAYSLAREFEVSQKIYEEVMTEEDVDLGGRETAAMGFVENSIRRGKDQTEALEILDGLALSKTTRPDYALYLKAETLKRVGRLKEAQESYHQIIAEYPKSNFIDQAYLNQAYILLNLGLKEQARDVIQFFVENFPNHRLNEKVHGDLIKLHIGLNEYDKAILASIDYLEKFKDSKEASNIHWMLATLYTETGEYQAAQETYENHGKKFTDENDAELLLALGYNAQKRGDLNQALSYYKRINQADSSRETYYQSLKNSAFCSVNLNLFDEAAVYYRRIVRDYPEQELEPEVYFWLLDYDRKNDNHEDMKMIINAFEKLSISEKFSAQIAFFKAEQLRLSKEFHQAIEWYDACILELDTFVTEAYLGKGKALRSIHGYESAALAFKNALKHAKDEHHLAVEARNGIAGVQYDAGNYEEAAKSFFAIAILYDDEEYVPPALLMAGESFEKIDQNDKAIQAYEELIQRFEKSAFSEKAMLRLKKIK